jgi:polar amino acid transport system substrate-binding protein
MRQLVFIAACIAAMLHPPALQAETLEILTTDWPPYVVKDMECHGFTAEVVCYAFLAAGYEVEFVFTSWDDNESLIKKGRYLAAFPHKRTPQRDNFALFSEPIAVSKDVFFYIKKSPEPIDFKDLADLKDYKIGGIKGYYNIDRLKKAGLQIDYAGDATTSFKKMYIGRVDLVPENEFVGWGIIQKLYPDEMYKFGTTAKALDQDSLHLMFSKAYPQSQALLEAFNRGLIEIMRQGVYRKLLLKYIQNVEIKMPTPVY